MAGKSQRFRKAGYELPKFFLDCGDRKMIAHVFEMFSSSDTFHLILSEDFEQDLNLKNYISALTPNIHFYFIKSHDLGPTKTIIDAQLMINDGSEIIVSYCDFTVLWDYDLFKRQVYGHDAGVPYFSGFQAASLGKTKYAYMQHENLRMTALKEKESFTKNSISEPASTGIYYFKSYDYFKILAGQLFSSNKEFPNNESYVSLLLNEVIESDGSVLLHKVDKFICFGTPEDYDQFNYWYAYFIEKPELNHQSFAESSLIPMAGEGMRFKNYGYKTSKPSIQIGNISLIQKCISSLPNSKNSFYILRDSDFKNKRLINDIKETDSASKINFIQTFEQTTGQAATCLLAADYLQKNKSLMISSCDYELIYNSKQLHFLKRSMKPDVIIFTFKLESLPVGSYNNFAYCETKDGYVTKIIEKECISETPSLDQMITGTFWFSRASFFIDAAKNLIDEDIRINNEHYVGTSINFLINQGLKVMTFEVDQWISFGDPVELDLYYFWEEYFNNSS